MGRCPDRQPVLLHCKESNQRNDAALANALPRQTKHQGIELGAAQTGLHGRSGSIDRRPDDGVMDSLILPWVNAHTMSMFLSTVSQRHPDEYIVMVMDQAGWHISHELEVPQNIRLVFLPPYSPEINPAEHIWDALRENCIGNTVFASLEAADKALSEGLRSLESAHPRMQSLTGFSWITSISLNAK